MRKNDVILVLALALAGCNGESKKATVQSNDTPLMSGIAALPADAQTDTTIVLTANDAMKYDRNEIYEKAGQKINFVLKHVGKLDKKVMGHNFVLVSANTGLVNFADLAAASADNDYIPKALSGEILAHTRMLSGGETDSIKFAVKEPNYYPFICSFPGHYSMMKGLFIVK